MSIAEITVVIRKEQGAACGFTLVRNSCTINKTIGIDEDDQLRPGDHIIRINDIGVNESSVRDVLRNCKELTEVHVTVARTAFHDKRFEDQARILGISSPVNNKKNRGSGRTFLCFPRLFGGSKTKKENAPPAPARRQSSSMGSYSPQGFGSVTSVSSTGMRTVDLRKLQKEGAGTMWKASRESSCHN
jgi:hypothetical protein